MSKNFLFTNKIFSKILAVFCTALWGSTAPVVKLMFDNLQIKNSNIPEQIYLSGITFFVSGIFILMFACVKFKKIPIIKPHTAKDTLLIASIQVSLQYIFLYIGISNTSSFKVSIISSFCTFFIIILSHFVYKDEKLSFQKILGCVLGVLSILVLNLEYSNNISLNFKILGEGFILFSAIAIALPTPICKNLSLKEDVSIFTGNSFLIGGMFLILIGLFFGSSVNAFSNNNIYFLIYLAVSSALSGVLWNSLLKYNQLSKISIYNLLVPVFGTLFSSVLLNEDVYQVKIIFSLILACSGIYLVEKVFKIKSVSIKKDV